MMERVLVVVAAVGLSPAVDAHPGGTDRYGCHTESATGTRHCHNGSSGGTGDSKLNGIPTAEVAIEAGASTWVGTPDVFGAEKIGIYGAIHLQHDGSMAFNANASTIKLLGAVALYIDLALGVAWLAQTNLFLTGGIAAGVQIPLYRRVGQRQALHLKLGIFIQLIADDVNAEPMGAQGVVGWTF